MELNKIIGTKNADGTRVLPELNIYGKPYAVGRHTTVTTVGVAPGKFVVVPNNFNDPDTLDKVKATFAAPVRSESTFTASTPPEVRSGRPSREVSNAGE